MVTPKKFVRMLVKVKHSGNGNYLRIFFLILTDLITIDTQYPFQFLQNSLSKQNNCVLECIFQNNSILT